MQNGEAQARALSTDQQQSVKIIDDETRPSPISFPQKREEADEAIHQTVVINGLSEHGGVNYIL